MSLAHIIAKFFGGATPASQASIGWGGWLDTAKGKRWEAIGEVVYDELAEAKVNVHKRQIIIPGEPVAKLTIQQAVRRIAGKTGLDIEVVREHLLLWLEEAAESDNEKRDEEVDMESAIARWVAEANKLVKSSR